jgi:hypothetical protein
MGAWQNDAEGYAVLLVLEGLLVLMAPLGRWVLVAVKAHEEKRDGRASARQSIRSKPWISTSTRSIRNCAHSSNAWRRFSSRSMKCVLP